MQGFTPITSFLGGTLIGLAAVVLLAANGRIAGVSGILAGLLRFEAAEIPWRAAFLGGLALGALAYRGLDPGSGITIEASVPLLAFAGAVIGFGTRIGGGCTSGHGVCGLARLSPRSLAATATFMAVAALTVFAVRHVF